MHQIMETFQIAGKNSEQKKGRIHIRDSIVSLSCLYHLHNPQSRVV